jgi:predicted RNA-binding Zn-ribbon protein involved in translation (DUF1610 family)
MIGASSIPMQCVSCDYDLRGTAGESAPRCPECGQSLADGAMARALERSFFRRLRRRLAALSMLVATLTTATLLAFPEHVLFVAPLLVLMVAPVAPVLLAAYCARVLPD